MSLRKIIFWMHLATGCVAGAVVLLMSVTGVLLAYERQIINWLDRDYHSNSPTSERLQVETLLRRLAEQNHPVPSAITLRSDYSAPAEAQFGREHTFLLDMHTGQVLGESAPKARAFFRSMEVWHRWFGVSDKNRATARAITGAANFGFMLLVISGPFLWIPRKWSWATLKAAGKFRLGLAGRARDFNWHNAIGIWCAAPLFLIVLSGVVMSYPWANNLLYRMTGNKPPAQGGGRGEAPAARARGGRGQNEHRDEKPAFAGLNSMWTRAEQQVPGWHSITLRIPPAGNGPLAFTMDTGNGGRPDQRSQLTLDRRTGDVIRWEPFSSYNSGRQLRAWFRFMHTGEAGGVAGETVASVATTGAAFLVWTGISLALRRLFRRRQSGKPAAIQSGQGSVVQSGVATGVR